MILQRTPFLAHCPMKLYSTFGWCCWARSKGIKMASVGGICKNNQPSIYVDCGCNVIVTAVFLYSSLPTGMFCSLMGDYYRYITTLEHRMGMILTLELSALKCYTCELLKLLSVCVCASPNMRFSSAKLRNGNL